MKRNVRLSPARVIVLSFLALILLGTTLLMLPVASVNQGSPPLKTALFTAVSATCVTGLVVQDTAQYWSGFGQGVILFLIQVGGMGVVTVSVVMMALAGKKIGLRQRWIMQQSISAPQVGGIVKMTGMIIKTSILVEAVGAAALAFVLCPEFGFFKGLWYAVFHSVSAFCNAGFDLMGVHGIPFSSLTAYRANSLLSTVIVLLILTGGIGFMTWKDFGEHGFRIKKYSLQSKLVLSTSAVLIFGGFLFMFFYEFGLPQWDQMGLGERFTAALFQTVTPRTAGFNTVELANLSPGGKMIMLMLMLIGGAPGSTAGGFKMTTIAVLILCISAAFRGEDHTESFGRTIPEKAVRNAAALFVLYLLMFIGAGVFIACYEGVALMDALFETGSAIATVGLSLGITPQLSTVSHIMLMLLMFFGRVGGLTLIYAVSKPQLPDGSRFPQEEVAIG